MHRFMLLVGMGTALLAGACADEPDTPIGVAASRNDAAEVRRLLAAGEAADQMDGRGMTPLLSAARAGALDAMRALLDAGADPNRRGALQDVDRPILGGCHTATVRALLAHDPDLQLPPTPAGHEALLWARLHDCAEVLKLVRIEEPPRH